MAKGDLLSDHEEVVRALWPPYWDADLKRASPSAFTQEQVSVSRLDIKPHDDIWRIYRANLDRVAAAASVGGEVSATATVGVGHVMKVCAGAETISVTVIEDQDDGEGVRVPNDAHALICGNSKEAVPAPKKLPRGLANKILEGCRYWMPA